MSLMEALVVRPQAPDSYEAATGSLGIRMSHGVWWVGHDGSRVIRRLGLVSELEIGGPGVRWTSQYSVVCLPLSGGICNRERG